MKEGDIGVEFFIPLERKDGVAIDFDEVETFTLYMQYEGSETIRDSEMLVVNAEDQTVNYYTVDGDLYQAGTLFLEVKLTMTNGNTFRCKTLKVKVEDSLSYPPIPEEEP